MTDTNLAQNTLNQPFATSEKIASERGQNNFLNQVNQEINRAIESNTDGVLKEMTFTHFKVSGKMLRPLFIKDLSKALGKNAELVVKWAATCELLHNATLVHDDLQDGDEVRRGAPTLWKIYGPKQAINIGDFLLIIAPQPVIKSSYPNKDLLLELFVKMSSEVVSGQAIEFELNKLHSAENIMKQYIHCIARKTSALFSEMAHGVCLISEQPKEVTYEIISIFFKLGLIFQMQDDILDLYGDKKRLEIGCDIKEGKVSFLAATHLDQYPKDFSTLKNILSRERTLTTQEDVLTVKELFERKNTLKRCVNIVQDNIEEIKSLPFLKKNSAIRELVENTLKEVLKPIDLIMTS